MTCTMTDSANRGSMLYFSLFSNHKWKFSTNPTFVYSMAASRSRRANAGCRMKEVMEKNEIDPFYAGLYGGFYDEENDAVSLHVCLCG